MQQLLVDELPREHGGNLSPEGMAQLYNHYRVSPVEVKPIWELWAVYACHRVLQTCDEQNTANGVVEMPDTSKAATATDGIERVNIVGQKLPYRTPSLIVHGSVRELTGNKSGVNTGDLATMMNTG
jgi:hypothetical protein